jgi:transposase
MSKFRFYVGIDLGNSQQAICVLDQNKKELSRQSVETNDVVSHLVRAIGQVPANEVAVAVEDRNNVVVDALLELGFAVFSINPKQADRFRDRMSASGAKDDRRDALVLARALYTDMEFFLQRPPLTELEAKMRIYRRREATLAEEVGRLSSKLYSLVQRLDPSLLTLCAGADEAWFWSLLLAVLPRKKPTAASIKALMKHAGKRKLDEFVPTLMAVINNGARARATEPLASVVMDEVRSLVTVLRPIEKERLKASKDLVAFVEDEGKKERVTDDGQVVLSTVAILLSMPGIGIKTAADLVADATPLLHRDKVNQLRAVAGVAPVTKQSGKSRSVSMRRACNPRLRNAMFHAAQAAVRHDVIFKNYLEKLLAAGHGRPRALRSVADRILRVLVSMLTSGTLYDPERATQAVAA